jgi:hypothetical protein
MALEIRRPRGEMAVALGLLAVAVGVLMAAARMPRGTVALPGPGFYPGALALLLGVTAVALLARGRVRPPEDGRVALGHAPVLVVLGALVGVALLLERLGFLPTMSLFLLLLFRTLSALGWWRSAVAALATAVAAWLFFARLLGVTLPG